MNLQLHTQMHVYRRVSYSILTRSGSNYIIEVFALIVKLLYYPNMCHRFLWTRKKCIVMFRIFIQRNYYDPPKEKKIEWRWTISERARQAYYVNTGKSYCLFMSIINVCDTRLACIYVSVSLNEKWANKN